MSYRKAPLPYILEDRTGLNNASDFDDIYDRIFFRIARPSPTRPVTMIYDMTRRASRHRDAIPLQRDPLVVMEFQQDDGLGTVSFKMIHAKPPISVTIPMSRWLTRTSMFGGSLSRKFLASDGKEYKWSHRSFAGHEWTCTTADDNYLVAQYELRPSDVQAYNVSGNNLTIQPHFGAIVVEVLASLTIMRHIAQHNL